MNERRKWEYRVDTFGTFWKQQSDEELEGTLNDWGEEGWEVVSLTFATNDNKVRAVAKRPRTGRLRRARNFPGEAGYEERD